MKRNKNRLIEVIRLLLKEKKVYLTLLLTLFALIGKLDAQTIWPAEISFNYSGSNAITLENNGLPNDAPEYPYKYGNDESYAAYIAGEGKISIKVKFSSTDASMNYLVKATVVSGTGLGNICEMFVASCDLNSKEFTIELPTELPTRVAKTSFTWEWEATALPTSSPFCPISCTSVNTSHVIYTLLSTPQAPMSTPWIDVLDYACVWAGGQTSNTGVISSITNNIYNCGIEYDGFEHYTKDSYTHLHLSELLNDLSSLENIQVDCRDFSNFLQVLTNALGVEGNYNRIRMGCNYNYIYPAGWSSKDEPDYWKYHQVGWYNSKVADAATKIDNDSDPTSSPHAWRLAIGDMTLSNYIDKQTEFSVKSEATGICTVY